MTAATWHMLQDSGPIDKEFANALAAELPVILWQPKRHLLPGHRAPAPLPRPTREASLQTGAFPSVRGSSRLPAAWVARSGKRLAGMLAQCSLDPESSVLVCTTPLLVGVAHAWPGPVVYWLSDFMARYASLSPGRVTALDRQLCRRANLVCPNSERLAEYLRDEADCAPEKLYVVPNAARVESLASSPQEASAALPPACNDLQRPVAGVIGNLAENTDWVLLLRTAELVPWLSWLFVGPTETRLPNAAQAAARREVMQLSRARFVGTKPHAELYRYARALDVAVLPYRRREPTYSGSSTRFYEHLAACHPMIATAGVAELRSKEPLLKLIASPEEAASALEALRARGFDDGLREVRWRASLQNTWQQRALAMRQALAARL